MLKNSYKKAENYISIEAQVQEKKQELYKSPEHMQDRYLYRVPNLIADFYTSIKEYIDYLDEKPDAKFLSEEASHETKT